MYLKKMWLILAEKVPRHLCPNFKAKVKYMYKTAVPELLRRMSKFQTMEEAIEASEAAHASYSALESANKTKIS